MGSPTQGEFLSHQVLMNILSFFFIFYELIICSWYFWYTINLKIISSTLIVRYKNGSLQLVSEPYLEDLTISSRERLPFGDYLVIFPCFCKKNFRFQTRIFFMKFVLSSIFLGWFYLSKINCWCCCSFYLWLENDVLEVLNISLLKKWRKMGEKINFVVS